MAVGSMCRGLSTNRCYSQHRRYHCNHPENGSNQPMQQPIKRVASDSQCLGLVTSACASVASCLNTIGHNEACFARLLADEFARAARCRAHCLWLCQPSCKIFFCSVLTRSHRPPSCPSINRGWICRGSTWLLADSSDSFVKSRYIIGFFKVCSLLWYKIYGDLGCK